ncbi:MAG: hypothetical protein U0841_23345 [Chloroflexia bacterium]
MGRRRVDADGAWKRVLSEMLAEFVAFALPGLHAAIDWAREPVFLEQELRPVLRQAALGRRVVDLIVQVWLQNGETTWLLVHVEVQGHVEDDFAERMFTYAALLHLRYRARRARRSRRQAAASDISPPSGLVGLALLTDANATWRPGDYRWGWEGYGIAYRYHALKLTDWRDRAELLAKAIARSPGSSAPGSPCRRPGRRRPLRRTRGALSGGNCSRRVAGAVGCRASTRDSHLLGALSGLADDVLEAIDQQLGLTERRPCRNAGLLTAGDGAGKRPRKGMLTTVLRLITRKGIALDEVTEVRIRGLSSQELLAHRCDP